MFLVQSLCKQLKISGRNFSLSKNLMCNVPEAVGTQKAVNVTEKKTEVPTAIEEKQPILEFTSVKGLKEFFDDQENWNANVVKVGRSWRVEELRIKSNSDLHKLWYVLLKEKNMLLTMKEEYEMKWKPMPNPERIDKVEESMTNIELVVRERNRAYHLLETGKTDERPHEIINDTFGLRRYHKFSEHLIPEFMNTKWQNKFKSRCTPEEIQEFLMLYREKLWLNKKRGSNRRRNHVMGLIKRYPNINIDMLKKQYPDVQVEKIKHNRKSQGHYDPIY